MKMIKSGTEHKADAKQAITGFELSNYNVLIVDDAPVNLGVY